MVDIFWQMNTQQAKFSVKKYVENIREYWNNKKIQLL